MEEVLSVHEANVGDLSRVRHVACHRDDTFVDVVEFCSRVLTDEASSLVSLRLYNVSIPIGSSPARLLEKLGATLPRLTRLEIDHCSMDHLMLFLTVGLVSKNVMSSIRHLSLRSNGIRNDDCVFLGTIMKLAHNIEYLDVSGNDFSTVYGAILPNELFSNTTLRTLVIANVALHASAVDRICDLVAANTPLQRLDVSGNDAEFIALPVALCRNNTLRDLNVKKTRCTLSRILPAMARNRTLVTLAADIAHNDRRTAALLVKVLRTHETLCNVDIGVRRDRVGGPNADVPRLLARAQTMCDDKKRASGDIAPSAAPHGRSRA